MDIVSTPHDKLIREFLSEKENAVSFFKNTLPKDVLDLIDLESINISKESFIEEDLKTSFSDILYHTSFENDPGYVYLLIEHKSSHEKWIHLQMLGYIINIWKLHIKQTDESLPIIIPLVLYHGKTKWNVDTDLASMISGPYEKLKQYIPDFQLILYDLAQKPDSELRGTILTQVMLLLFKHIYDKDIRKKLPGILELLHNLIMPDTGKRSIETIIIYLFSTIEGIQVDDVEKIFEQARIKNKRGLIMTLAEQLKKEGIDIGYQKAIQEEKPQWIQQGVQQGVKQGVQQGILEAIELGISLKFGDDALFLMQHVRSIGDIDRLRAIKDALKKVDSLEELKKMLN